MTSWRTIIIGSSAAGISALTTLKRLNPSARVTLITQDPYYPYNVCKVIGYALNNVMHEQLRFIAPRKVVELSELFVRQAVVTSVNTQKQCIYYDHNQRTKELTYDYLLFATGASSRLTQAFAVALEQYAGLFQLYTKQDARAIRSYRIRYNVQQAIVVGAGLTGLECAFGLAAQGIHVTIVEKQPCIMSALYNQCIGLSDFLIKLLALHNITIYTDATISSYQPRSTISSQIGSVLIRHKTDSLHVIADMVIWAGGVAPQVELAQHAGLTVHRGIQVNQLLQTSNASIYAAGDCAELIMNQQTGNLASMRTWASAIEQGICAGYNLAGYSKLYKNRTFFLLGKLGNYMLVAEGIISTHEKPKHMIVNEKNMTYSAEFTHGFLYVGTDMLAVAKLRNAIT